MACQKIEDCVVSMFVAESCVLASDSGTCDGSMVDVEFFTWGAQSGGHLSFLG